MKLTRSKAEQNGDMVLQLKLCPPKICPIRSECSAGHYYVRLNQKQNGRMQVVSVSPSVRLQRVSTTQLTGLSSLAYTCPFA